MKRYAPPPDWLDAPPGTKVANIYYFDSDGELTEDSSVAQKIEVVYWADEEETIMTGSEHGERV